MAFVLLIMLIYLRFRQITIFHDSTFLLQFGFTSIIDFFYMYLLIILQDFVLFNRERIASFYSCIAKTTTMYMNTICFEFFPLLHGKNHSFFCNSFFRFRLNNQVSNTFKYNAWFAYLIGASCFIALFSAA